MFIDGNHMAVYFSTDSILYIPYVEDSDTHCDQIWACLHNRMLKLTIKI